MIKLAQKNVIYYDEVKTILPINIYFSYPLNGGENMFFFSNKFIYIN